MRSAGFTVPVSVNLSRRQLLDGDVVARLQAALAADLGDALQVEVGEPVVAAADPRVRQTLAAIAGLGVTIVVDDVGSGVSSLRALAQLRSPLVKMEQPALRRRSPAAPRPPQSSPPWWLWWAAPAAASSPRASRATRRRGRCGSSAATPWGISTDTRCPPTSGWRPLRWACTAVVGSDGPTTLQVVRPGVRAAKRGGAAAAARDGTDVVRRGARVVGPVLDVVTCARRVWW